MPGDPKVRFVQYAKYIIKKEMKRHAKYIFDVLNDAGANGLNIFFLHGHDHAYGPDNYMGGEAIYLPVGDKICIAEADSTSAWTEETLNFTYMNAGYPGIRLRY